MSDIMRIGFLLLVDAAARILARELGLGEGEGLIRPSTRAPR